MLFAAELYIATRVGDCGWTIYVRIVQIEVGFWKFSNNPPHSDSVTEAIMLRMILHSTCIVPFDWVIS